MKNFIELFPVEDRAITIVLMGIVFVMGLVAALSVIKDIALSGCVM